MVIRNEIKSLTNNYYQEHKMMRICDVLEVNIKFHLLKIHYFRQRHFCLKYIIFIVALFGCYICILHNMRII